ncbi:MAG: hypothetical protein HKN91_11625 [Acidimicrobiia bacterium]|nr:hypothetical protein [Acidimicrobiia bacterium]
MSTTRYRIILSVLGLAFGALVIGAVILAPSGDVTELPGALESFSPADGAIVQRQTALEVDLQVGYSLTLVIDGITVPAEDLEFTEATGQYVFRPGPDKVVAEWLPGFHIVEIAFDRTVGLPDPGSLRWSFRIQ